MTDDEEILRLVLGKLDSVRHQGGYWKARCPVPEHEDREASLSVKRGTKQPVLIKCHAGCDTVTLLGAIGLTLADIGRQERRDAPAGGEWMPGGRRSIAVYNYTDGNRKILFQVLRSEDKKFSQRRPDPSARKGWRWNLDGVSRVPYRLPELIKAVNAGQLVYVAEGEKDVHALEAAGAVATCNPGGTGAGWRDEYDGWFVGAEVIVVADKDKPGRQHAADVAGHLRKVAKSVTVLEAAEGKDAADHLAAGHGLADLRPAQPDDSPSDPPAVDSHLHTPPSWVTDQDILAKLVCDMGVWCGFTGEHRNAKLTYLAVTSRILDDPVSIAVKGLSSSGKSYTVTAVLKFFPDDAVITMTAMSERALIYMKDDFAHKTLVLFEAVALREEREKSESNLTAYIVRSLLSEGEIRYPVAVRGPDGKMVTETIVKKGPTNFIVTTTATSLHGENETRMLSLPTDDSAEQTTSVMKAIAAGQRTDADFSEWHAFARWIAAGNKNVVIPYADWLAENIPPVAVRLRRDFRAVLRLIEAHAILHQMNRETDGAGRIVATEADYLAVRQLVADLISDAVGSSVSPVTRETVETVDKLDGGEGVKVHDLAEHLRLERSTVQYRVSAAREKGYLVNVEDKKGRAARYKTGNPLPDDIVILPERIAGVNPHPEPASHTPADVAPQVSHDADVGCEGVNEPHEGEPPACTICGEPLAQVLIDAGFTDHGEEPAA